MTLEQVGILTGIISTILTGLYFTYKYYKEKQLKIREKITGQWGNEGDVVLSKYETHYIELSLTIDKEDGEISGTIKSRHLNGETKSPYCSVHGKLRNCYATLKIIHVRHGEVLDYGKAKIKFKKKLLYWKLEEGIADFFPITTKLQKYFTQVFK